MEKIKEKLSKNGKIWVHIPEMNRREVSGVEFRGVYMTVAQYRRWRKKNALLQIVRKTNGSSK